MSLHKNREKIMKLSVVIPCFNDSQTIATQLEALSFQQCSEPWEVVVSDNGSTDNTITIVEQYREKLPGLKIVDSSERQGAAHARNQGVLAATGEAIAFCDADDEVAPGWVAAMSKALSHYDFVACKREYHKLNPPWTLKYRPHTQQTGLQEYKYPPFLPHASGSTLGIKRFIHISIGGFDETMLRLQDTDYCWKVQLSGVKLHFVPDAVVHYRLRDTLPDLCKQAREWGKYNVLLYQKYQSQGLPRLPWYSGLIIWIHVVRRSPHLLSTKYRAKWLWNFAWQVGRLQGCLEYQVWAL